MRDDERLRAIRDDQWLANMLAQFDFDIDRADDPIELVRLLSGEALTAIAGDDTGGTFYRVGERLDRFAVVYAGSEGQGGLVAHSLGDALALIVGLSSIHDAAVTFAGDDDLSQLRRHLAKADDEMREYFPNLDADRAQVRVALDLPNADDLLPVFRAAMADDSFRPISEWGPLESMLR